MTTFNPLTQVAGTFKGGKGGKSGNLFKGKGKNKGKGKGKKGKSTGKNKSGKP